MKKKLYICVNPIENWDIFTPLLSGNPVPDTMSLVLLHDKQDLENVPLSQVWVLDRSEQHDDGVNAHKRISYQEMLEQVFAHDLSMVI